jgi:hypothetical protein
MTLSVKLGNIFFTYRNSTAITKMQSGTIVSRYINKVPKVIIND